MSDLVKYEERSLLPPAGEWSTILSMAATFVKSGLLPVAVNTTEKAAVIILKGRELGIPPMQAFASINVIKGKPSLSAELMVAMVRDRGHSIKMIESTDKVCSLKGKRRDTGDEFTSTFTYEMAKQALLTGPESMYAKYPTNMLWARSATNLCRFLFSDIIMGMPSTEEVVEYAPTQQETALPSRPSEVVVDKTSGEIIETTAQPVEAPKQDKPKQHKKLTREEYDKRGEVAARIFEMTGLNTNNEDGSFPPITLNDFNTVTNKITGCANAGFAMKKYGLEGNLSDLVAKEYKGDGLTWEQKLSAGLHILWKLEQEYLEREANTESQSEEEVMKEQDEWDLFGQPVAVKA